MRKLAWEELYQLGIVKKARAWNRMRDADTITGLNRRMRHGGFEELIRDADSVYDAAVRKSAEEIVKRRDSVRMVIVAGPSSSGKTTTTLKLCEELRALGEDPQMVSLDNYFWNLMDQPQDEFGDRDFENPDALDKKLIRENLRDLIAGKEVITPVYNFKTGSREKTGVGMKINRRQLLVIEGLHAFHGDMTAGIPQDLQFRIYIEAICQLKDRHGHFIPWTDIRLLRRMVRDSLHRNFTPLKTLEHWHYVRAAEKEHIVPFINDTGAVVNGYLPYELPVHKKYLGRSLREAITHFGKARGKEDALRRASRCLRYFDEVEALEDDSIIPPTSLLREFIGGTAYA